MCVSVCACACVCVYVCVERETFRINNIFEDEGRRNSVEIKRGMRE